MATSPSKFECKLTEKTYAAILRTRLLSDHGYQKHDDRGESDHSESSTNSPDLHGSQLSNQSMQIEDPIKHMKYASPVRRTEPLLGYQLPKVQKQLSFQLRKISNKTTGISTRLSTRKKSLGLAKLSCNCKYHFYLFSFLPG